MILHHCSFMIQNSFDIKLINAPPFCMENFEFSILKKLTQKLIEILLSGNTKKKKKKAI